jgi:hypothetical protein
MAFLDNSGDIILDAVLTDTGRKRMAQGSFRIQKFALGDDEIDYGLYNKDAPGSEDLDILGTPILEAFTDNASGLKSKLLTVAGGEKLYLPVIKLHNEGDTKPRNDGAFYIVVNSATRANFSSDNGGVMTYAIDGSDFSTYIQTHQGIDNASTGITTLPTELKENQYIIEIDNLLGAVYNNTNQAKTVSYIDDDNIASYFLYKTANGDSDEVKDLLANANATIAGPLGTSLSFRIKPQPALTLDSPAWFLRLGGEVEIDTNTYYYIDTTVKVMGATTGYRIDIPLRFLRLKA